MVSPFVRNSVALSGLVTATESIAWPVSASSMRSGLGGALDEVVARLRLGVDDQDCHRGSYVLSERVSFVRGRVSCGAIITNL